MKRLPVIAASVAAIAAFADINSDIGTGNNMDNVVNQSKGDEFHLLEFHLPTAGVGFSIVLGLGLVVFVAWFLYRRHTRKHKARLAYQKMLTWEAR